MKNLVAAVSYSFNNFYNNLNKQGQMVFTAIIFLILLLCILLFISYVVQGIQNKIRIKKIDEKNKNKKDAVDEKVPVVTKINEDRVPLYTEEKTEIQDIAESIEKALKEDTPITLTNFEEDQERTAIISIDELMKRAKDLQIADDEEVSKVNYLEKYNLEPSEVEKMVEQTTNTNKTPEVKAFKVSQVISPVYGVKKEVINRSE